MSSLLAFLRHSSIFPSREKDRKSILPLALFPADLDEIRATAAANKIGRGAQFVRYEVRKEEDWKALDYVRRKFRIVNRSRRGYPKFAEYIKSRSLPVQRRIGAGEAEDKYRTLAP